MVFAPYSRAISIIIFFLHSAGRSVHRHSIAKIMELFVGI